MKQIVFILPQQAKTHIIWYIAVLPVYDFLLFMTVDTYKAYEAL